MRKLIFEKLNANFAITSLIPALPAEPNPARIYQWGSLGTGDIPPKPEFPFVLVAEQPQRVNREVRDQKSSKRTFFFYAYDQHGTGYLRIEQILSLVRDTLIVLNGVVSPSGARCTEVKWLGWSVDSRDPEYVANMKYGSFSFIESH